MAFDAFIKIDGITGEAEDHKHKGEIEVISYNFGVAQTGTSAAGTGAGSGKCELKNLAFSKKIDKSSPVLFQKSATGEHIPSALLVVRKAGGTQLEFVKVKMTDVVVSKFDTGGETYLRRLTLSIVDGVIDWVFYPVHPPDTHARDVLAWLTDHVGYALEGRINPHMTLNR